MAFELPRLRFDGTALEPHISAETIEYHHGKHHRAYVDNLNRLTEGTDLEQRSLEDLIRTTEGALFNNAAQVWNHTFYFNCMSPDHGGDPSDELAHLLAETFGTVADFKRQFSAAAVGHFGSGWAWLVQEPDGTLAIRTTANADSPIADGGTPLLTCDVWEHAYYIDYRNARPKYVEAFWNLVNWEFVAANLGD
jgi:Fe-Mn family superoxide dismutase